MQALVACNEAPCLLTSSPLCPKSTLKISFNKTMSAIPTSSPRLHKRCMLRSTHVISCSFVSDGAWKNKNWKISASLETEAIPQEPAEEEQTVVIPQDPAEEEQTVAISQELAEEEQTVAIPQEPAEVEQTVAIPEEPTITTAEESDLPTVRVKFVLEKECQFGERYNVVGNDPLFGNWDPEAGVPMHWSEGHSWSVEKDVPIGKRIEFKFILTGKDEIEWQPGANRYFETTDSSISPLVVSIPWVSEEEEIEEGKPEEAPVEEGTEAATVLGDASLVDSGLDLATVLGDASLADSGLGFAPGNQVSNEEEIPRKRDIPVDEGNGQLPVSVSSDDEDKPETTSELSTPEAALVTAILDATQRDEFQS